ncbi:transmembrane protein 65 [Brevipalpus obovatus]|uniref:transmembrane protein 65 n=1 Tax=Brevipalpus obovatus TaxID=246614 RepID=UPI003D9E45ED
MKALQILMKLKPMNELNQICPLTHRIVSKANYKTRSFLSDTDGVKRFVDLLGTKERRMLLDELDARRELIVPIVDSTESSTSEQLPPSFTQLRQIATHQALPFIGFGFLDNFIMILAGEYIDTTIGVTLGISTMAAAGLGNAVSDVAGIGSAWYVESISSQIGIEYPKITPAQSDMVRTRWTVQLGRCIGIVIGCILGMCPLWFYKKEEKNTDGSKEESNTSNNKK